METSLQTIRNAVASCAPFLDIPGNPFYCSWILCRLEPLRPQMEQIMREGGQEKEEMKKYVAIIKLLSLPFDK